MSSTCWIPLATLLVACAAPGADDAEESEDISQPLAQVTGFGSNPGNLQMFTHVPAGLPANAPVVLVLHGCTQTAAGMEASGWTAAANAHKFYLIYAQQQSANNGATCFNWFEPGDLARGQGEALSLRQMVGWVLANASTDPQRVFVMGFSSGGFMASVMAATYPDVFAGAAISAGGPYRCAASSNEAFSCMNPGVNRTPAAWGDLVRSAFPGHTGRRPRITIWHGASDTTVRPLNLTEAMEQWTDVLGADQVPDLTETIAGHTHKVYQDGSGAAVVETYELAGLGHAVPVDPQFTIPGGAACGSIGSFISDANICGVHQQEKFFGLVATDITPPSAQLTSPAAGAELTGTVLLAATASDEVGVARVDFLVDGAQVGSDTTAPYELAWSSATVADGAHTITARAVDTGGNTATSSRAVTTNNGSTGSTTVSFPGIAAEDGYVKALADGSSPSVGIMTTLAVGRGTDGKLNRTILSFDTSSLPDGAVVIDATVTVTYASGSGNPWTSPADNSLVVDVRRGTFGAAGTETSDWAAAADATAAATIAAFSSGTRTSSQLSAAGRAAIHTAGRTQLRLRFTQNQTGTAYVFVGQGTGATLTVTYQ